FISLLTPAAILHKESSGMFDAIFLYHVFKDKRLLSLVTARSISFNPGQLRPADVLYIQKKVGMLQERNRNANECLRGRYKQKSGRPFLADENRKITREK
ncbi:MAG: hypothetical protein ABIJ44_02045, partial [Pseudomonadota bacterium]